MMEPKVLVRTLSEKEKEEMKISSWPIWTKEISEFPYTYDATEDCYILEGEVIVTTKEGSFHIKPHDFVTFDDGLKCRWNIIKPIRKHYNFR